MPEKPNDFNEKDITLRSSFPEANDPDIDTKIAVIIQALGIPQNTDEEFLNTLESELVSKVDENAHLAVKADELRLPPPQRSIDLQQSSSSATLNTKEEDIPVAAQEYDLRQQKIIAKKLQLYKKTQENIKEEIKRLLAISGNENLSPENAAQINRLISNMRSLDQRIEFYTQKDQIIHQRQQEREKSMIQMNQKKKLVEKIKKEKKEVEKAKADLEKKDLASFFLPGKWLEVYRNNQKSMIAEKEKYIAESEKQLKTIVTKEQESGSQSPQPRTVDKENHRPISLQTASSTTDTKPLTAPDTKEAEQPIVQTSIQQPTHTERPQLTQQEYPRIPSPQTTLQQKANPNNIPSTPHPATHQMFAELFEHPTVKGTAGRSPDSQSGQIMQKAENLRNTRVTQQATDLRTQEQRSAKQKSNRS